MPYPNVAISITALLIQLVTLGHPIVVYRLLFVHMLPN